MNQMISKIKSKMLIKTAEAELLHNNFDGMKLSLFTGRNIVIKLKNLPSPYIFTLQKPTSM